jgi:hypothetical protein
VILGAWKNDPALLEEALEAFRQALLELTPERFPFRTQIAIGSAREELGRQKGDPALLAEAVGAYHQALLECTRE